MSGLRDLNEIKRREQELLLQNEMLDKQNQELFRNMPRKME